jgi:hypothetical protein
MSSWSVAVDDAYRYLVSVYDANDFVLGRAVEVIFGILFVHPR